MKSANNACFLGGESDILGCDVVRHQRKFAVRHMMNLSRRYFRCQTDLVRSISNHVINEKSEVHFQPFVLLYITVFKSYKYFSW